ncbi:amidase [Fonsecaea nubica]|uniref:Amidase n=1 Tax=Fonsecaea nubica TaxID=856822 RepID=A0A178C9N8_9EURO|nr:amidase [Fonsecaea nubica]OAL26267.1 amidase [Fonsecaea nubica]
MDTYSVVGVSTQCVPSFEQIGYVVFNCTEIFHGVLGADPSISSDTILWTHIDATTPGFNFKHDRNFECAYFSDAQLNAINNSIGGNATNDGASGKFALADDKLINPIFLAVAGLIPVQDGPVGESLSKDRNLLSTGAALVAYTPNCSIMSYDVAYDWINGSIISFSFTQPRTAAPSNLPTACRQRECRGGASSRKVGLKAYPGGGHACSSSSLDYDHEYL